MEDAVIELTSWIGSFYVTGSLINCELFYFYERHIHSLVKRTDLLFKGLDVVSEIIPRSLQLRRKPADIMSSHLLC